MKTIITNDSNPATYCSEHLDAAINSLLTNSIAFSVEDAAYGECITCAAQASAAAVAAALATLSE